MSHHDRPDGRAGAPAHTPDAPLPRGARFAGLAVIVLTFLSAAALITIIALTQPRPFWTPERFELWGIEIMYDTHAPAIGLLLAAIAFAIIVGAGVSLHETLVIRRYRRTDPSVVKRPLAPRTIMEETRGVYAGPVTITALIPAHNEAASLPTTIASLQAQTEPPERIIVIADNCTDNTVALALACGAEVYETVNNSLKKAGGLNQILTRILPDMGPNDTALIMDADTQFGSDRFLETARARMTADRALMAVGGLFTGEPGHGLLGQFQRNEFTRYCREIRRRRGKVFVLTGTASVFRATALRAVADSRGTLIPGITGDVYDTIALTEDNEITIAIKSLGGLTTSPSECTVITELMPSWRMLWKQRLRWQRGALENLGQYGVTSTTIRYWSQQIGIGYSVIALASYFALILLMLVSIDHWVWFTFWIGIGLVFALERVVTVWQGGWRARVLAALVLPELVYDFFMDVVFVKGIVDMTFSREAKWSHLAAVSPESSPAEPAHRDAKHPDSTKLDSASPTGRHAK